MLKYQQKLKHSNNIICLYFITVSNLLLLNIYEIIMDHTRVAFVEVDGDFNKIIRL